MALIGVVVRAIRWTDVNRFNLTACVQSCYCLKTSNVWTRFT